MKPFAYEWRRMATLRSTWILTAISLIFTFATAFLAFPITSEDPSRNGWIGLLTLSVPNVVAFCCGLVGVFGVGHEYRYGTIRPTLTAMPRRVPVIVAKLLVPACFTVALAAVSELMVFGIGWLCVRDRLETPVMSATVIRCVIGACLFAVGYCIIGSGLTALFRNQVAGVVLILVFPLIVENAISAALYLIPWFDKVQGSARYLPFSAGRAMYGLPPTYVDPDFPYRPLAPLAGGLVYFGIATVICALGIRRFVRSDA